MAFPPTAVLGSFAVITLRQVWRGITLNIADLGIQEKAPSLLCGSDNRFSIFCFIIFFSSYKWHTQSSVKKGEALKSSTQTFDSSNLPF